MQRKYWVKWLVLVCLWVAGQPPAWGQPARPERATVQSELSVKALPAGSKAVLAIVVEVKEGFHAQSHKPLDENLIAFAVTMAKNDALSVGEVKYPEGKIEEYPKLGKLSVYSGKTVIYVPIEVKADAKPGVVTIEGKVRYQVCDDTQCYFPENKKITIETKIVPAGEKAEENKPELFKDYKPESRPPPGATRGGPPDMAPPVGPGAPTGVARENALNIKEEPPRWSIGWALMEAFLAGVIFNVMPCVLPVLPLKAMSFYEVAKHNRAKTLLLALVFSAGIVTVFGILATLILVTRQLQWGQLFTYGWFVWGLVVLLAGMALGMFGFFTVALPTSVYSITPRHDTYTGNYLFGGLTAILSTPCTAYLFPPLLAWASAQPKSLGVIAMLMVGVGMAAPYVLLSAFPEMARRLPKAGPWSELFKQMLGWMLIAAAVYFAAGRVISGPKFWYAVLVIAAVASLYLVIRAWTLSGGRLRPVAIAMGLAILIVAGTGAHARRMNQTPVKWEHFSDTRLAEAIAQKKIVLVKFTANWCANCQYIEATVYHDKATAAELQDRGVVALKADLTHEDAPGSELLGRLNPAGGIPLTAIYFPGREQPVQLSSVYTTQTLLSVLEEGAKRQLAVK